MMVNTFQPAATEDRQNPDPRCAQRKGRGFRNDDDVHAKRALPLLRARAPSDTTARGGDPTHGANAVVVPHIEVGGGMRREEQPVARAGGEIKRGGRREGGQSSARCAEEPRGGQGARRKSGGERKAPAVIEPDLHINQLGSVNMVDADFEVGEQTADAGSEGVAVPLIIRAAHI